MRSVRVVVDTAKERGRRVAADVLREHVTSSGMIIEERADVVNEARDNDEWTLGSLLLDYTDNEQSV